MSENDIEKYTPGLLDGLEQRYGTGDVRDSLNAEGEISASKRDLRAPVIFFVLVAVAVAFAAWYYFRGTEPARSLLDLAGCDSRNLASSDSPEVSAWIAQRNYERVRSDLLMVGNAVSALSETDRLGLMLDVACLGGPPAIELADWVRDSQVFDQNIREQLRIELTNAGSN